MLKKLLLTGVAGFIGRYVARFFLSKVGQLLALIAHRQRMHLYLTWQLTTVCNFQIQN